MTQEDNLLPDRDEAVVRAFDEIAQEWEIIASEHEALLKEYLVDEAPTLAARKLLPALIANFRNGMSTADIIQAEKAVLDMDKHVLYTAQLYLNIMEVGFSREQAFVLLCRTMG